PTPGDFQAAYEELGEYERVYSLHIAGTLSGTVESSRAAAGEFGDRIRVVDTETASAAVAMLGLAFQRRLERGPTDDEVEKLVRRAGAARRDRRRGRARSRRGAEGAGTADAATCGARARDDARPRDRHPRRSRHRRALLVRR